jgi:hypothetical protein
VEEEAKENSSGTSTSVASNNRNEIEMQSKKKKVIYISNKKNSEIMRILIKKSFKFDFFIFRT